MKKQEKKTAEMIMELTIKVKAGEITAAEMLEELERITKAAEADELKAATTEEARRAAYEKKLEQLEAMKARAAELVEKVKAGKATKEDRRELLGMLNWSYHKSGKIQGIWSVDGCAVCEFCEKMRAAAGNNILIICGYCYAAADLWKKYVFYRHSINMLILSEVLFTAEELRGSMQAAGMDVENVKFLRINEDGDTVNETHARNNLRAAEVLKPYGGRVGYFFKHTAAVEAGLIAEGITSREQLPENVVFVQSSLLIGFEARPAWFADIVFTVYPDKDTTEAAIAGGAFECNGRKCMNCGHNCYKHKRAAGVQYVAEVLRASKNQRAAILQAYYEEKARRTAAAV